jgi:methanogenic corrinoid protein MtbC1
LSQPVALLDDIAAAVEAGDSVSVRRLVEEAVADGVPALSVNADGLLSGMAAVGEKFRDGEIYIPEVLVASRALKAGLELLRPLLVRGSAKPCGTVVLGTVKGDLHDIGKNLVALMMESRGLDVVDLGVNVEAEEVVASAGKVGAQVIACSALLSSTLLEMERVVHVVEGAGLSDTLSLLIGGAPVTDAYCRFIGADAYAADAASGASAALDLCRSHCEQFAARGSQNPSAEGS